jgi:hypothetical protein
MNINPFLVSHLFHRPLSSGDNTKKNEKRDATSKRAALLTLVAKERALAATGESVLLFGKGHKERLSNMWGIENAIQMPLAAETAKVDGLV